MNNNELKKKIIYRSNYRGSKEMDLLISSFVKKVINTFNEKQLIQLNELVNLDDETLFRLNREPNINQKKKKNEIVKLFQKFKILWRKDWDSNPGKSCPFAGFQDRCFQPLSHPSVNECL